MEQVPKTMSEFEDVRWVFFDFDGTLRHNEPNGLHTFHKFVEARGVPLAASVRREAFRWNHRYWASSEMLRQDEKEAGEEIEGLYQRYTRRYLQQLGVNGDRLNHLAPELHRQMSEEYQPEDHVPAEVPSTLRELRQRGYLLALISNRRHPLDEKVTELGLDEYFEFTLAAGQVGSWKPDPGLLQRAAHQAGIEPHQSIYVGDNPYADVAGARAANIQPVLIDPDGLFPDVDCPVIDQIDQLVPLLA